MTKDNTFIKKRIKPYIRRMAAAFMVFSMCAGLLSCAQSNPRATEAETEAYGKNVEITFEDAGVEGALRQGMYKPDGSIMSNELLKFNMLSIDRRDASETDTFKAMKWLADLRWIPNLEKLYLLNCGIENAEGIETLKKLRVLDLRDNAIQDLAPIGELTELTDLRCSVTAETDYSALQSCTKLTSLVIEGDGAPEMDLDFVKDMTQLEYLRINHAGVRDIRVLENLKRLKQLDLRGNCIQDITPLQELKKLKILSLSENKIQDVTPLQNSLQLSELYLSDNEIKDITPLHKFGYIFNLHLEGNQIQDITPIMGFQNKNAVRLENNPIPEKLLEEFTQSAEDNTKTATAPVTSEASEAAETVEADQQIGAAGEKKETEDTPPNRTEELQKLRIEPVVGKVTSYMKIDNAMYGLTEDGEAALIHYAKVKGADKTIAIPDSVEGCAVTVIAGGAIKDSNVEKIVLPVNLRTIENAAITGCEKLRELDIPSMVTQIGNNNFGLLSSYEGEAVWNPWVIRELEKSGNDMLIANGHLLLCAKDSPSVTIPDGVRVITAGAFAANIKEEAYGTGHKVQQLVLPDSLRAIYSLPESLRYMDVPKHVADIELNGTLLEYMPWLRKRQEASENNAVIINGILLSAQGQGKFTVPDGVWKISGVIRDKYAIKSIVLPDGVEEIGAYTFSGCAYMEEVEFGENVRYIGEEAFAYCDSMDKVRLPYGIKTIARGSFYKCERLDKVTIPLGVATIGEKAFYKCDRLHEATLPIGIRYIGNRAFQGCKLQKNVLPRSLRYIGTLAFENNFGLKSIVIPKEVCYVASGAFANSSELKYIRLEDGVDYIGDRVFDILIAEDEHLNGTDRDDFADWLSREEVVIELPYQLPVFIEPSVWEDFSANSYVQLRTDIVFVVRKTSKTVDTLRKYMNDNDITKYRITYTYFPPLQLRRQESVIGELYDTSDSILRKEKKFETLRNRQFSRYDRY